MAKSKKRSPSGLVSEAAKKATRAVRDAVKKPAKRKKSATGNLSEAAKKAGRAVADTARKAVGMKPTRLKKSGSK